MKETIREYWVYDEETKDVCRDEQGMIKCFATNEEAMEYGFDNLNYFHTVAHCVLGE